LKRGEKGRKKMNRQELDCNSICNSSEISSIINEDGCGDDDDNVLDFTTDDECHDYSTTDGDDNDESSSSASSSPSSYRNNIFADTPYYNATVAREMNHLRNRGFVFKDILSKASIFTDAGKRSALAAKHLSISCQLKNQQQHTSAASAAEALLYKEETQRKKDAMGPRMVQTLESFAEFMEEIAVAQESMCKTIESILCEQILQDTQRELELAQSLQKLAIEETKASEVLFYEYLNTSRTEIENQSNRSSKKQQKNNHRRKSPTSTATAIVANVLRDGDKNNNNNKPVSSSSSSSMNWNTQKVIKHRSSNNNSNNDDEAAKISKKKKGSSRWHVLTSRFVGCTAPKKEEDFSNDTAEDLTDDDGSDNNSSTSTNIVTNSHHNNSSSSNHEKLFLKPEKIADLKYKMQIIKRKQARAELLRLRVLKQFVDTKHQRELQFSRRVGQAANQMQYFFYQVTNSAIRMKLSVQTMEEEEGCNYDGNNNNYRITNNHKNNNTNRTLDLLFIDGWNKMEHSLENAVDDHTNNVVKSLHNLRGTETTISHHDNKNNNSNSSNNNECCTPNFSHNIFSLEMIEEEMRLWKTSKMIARCTSGVSRYNNNKRNTAKGIAIEGWMYEKVESLMSSSWCKRWYMIKDDGALYYLELDEHNHNSYNQEMSLTNNNNNTTSSSLSPVLYNRVKICDIVLSSVREELPGDTNNNDPFCFQLIINNRKSITFKTRGPNDYKMWVNGIRSSIGDRIVNGNFDSLSEKGGSSDLNKGIGKRYRTVSSEITETLQNTRGVFNHGGERNLFWKIIAEKQKQRDNNKKKKKKNGHNKNKTTTTKEKKSKFNKNNSSIPYVSSSSKPAVMQIMKKNATCADCGKASPKWVSLNLGVVICIECSGVHRSLGAHISKVRSLMLDYLNDNEINLLLGLGNNYSNGIWEKQLSSKDEKPTPVSNRKTREEWITRKYVQKEFTGGEKLLLPNNDNEGDGGVVVITGGGKLALDSCRGCKNTKKTEYNAAMA